jgi:hypothetical protein
MRNQKAVNVVTSNDEILKLRKIGIESGKVFGMLGKTGRLKKMMLNINNIKVITLL